MNTDSHSKQERLYSSDPWHRPGRADSSAAGHLHWPGGHSGGQQCLYLLFSGSSGDMLSRDEADLFQYEFSSSYLLLLYCIVH